jgi:hypothetical protein
MAIVILILGVASLAFGVLFVTEASSAEQEIADSIQPLTIAEVDARYDTVKESQMALRMVEEPEIQAGKAAPSAMYNYLTIQRTALGLTRSQIGLVSFTMTSGIINVILGLGLILAGVGLLKKARA